ncbi:MAG: DUF4834 domain-containing protein [Flavobacteriales bacterium]|nr:DUF4834 domain-containing protein [Flavobacteriales bacterium]
MGLLKTIFGIILFYYAFKFIARLFFPYLLKSFVNKAQRNMQDQFDQQKNQQKRKEGEVHVKGKQQQSDTHQIEAEDVDFEEVD